mmetsp:Transcript_106208/g.158889  ORF Transcript_106208/g.158889 Transcript_106208/m.158889 type:complete len:308 (+) Transcript_106208:376-1299(+)
MFLALWYWHSTLPARFTWVRVRCKVLPSARIASPRLRTPTPLSSWLLDRSSRRKLSSFARAFARLSHAVSSISFRPRCSAVSAGTRPLLMLSSSCSAPAKSMPLSAKCNTFSDALSSNGHGFLIWFPPQRSAVSAVHRFTAPTMAAKPASSSRFPYKSKCWSVAHVGRYGARFAAPWTPSSLQPRISRCSAPHCRRTWPTRRAPCSLRKLPYRLISVSCGPRIDTPVGPAGTGTTLTLVPAFGVSESRDSTVTTSRALPPRLRSSSRRLRWPTAALCRCRIASGLRLLLPMLSFFRMGHRLRTGTRL